MQLPQGGAEPLWLAAIVLLFKVTYETVLREKGRRNGNATGDKPTCNYPQYGGGCAYASKDFADMRRVEIVQGLGLVINPALERQNEILEEIRDEARLRH